MRPLASKAQEISVQATHSGTFIVVVGDSNLALGDIRGYRLTLAKTGEPIVVTTGDEGGAMLGTNTYDGTIDVGDLDAFSFTICAGEPISGAPFGFWSPILTNQFDQFGVFNRTNPLIHSEPERYFQFIHE